MTVISTGPREREYARACLVTKNRESLEWLSIAFKKRGEFRAAGGDTKGAARDRQEVRKLLRSL